MANSAGIITAPVSLAADVYSVLGLDKTSSGYDLAYACSNSHGKINQWSLKKPVCYDSPVLDVDASGFEVEPATSDSKTQFYFRYNPPTPGTDWCRLGDFNGYNHNTLAPYLSPDNYNFIAITPDNIGSDNDSYEFHIDLYNSKTLLSLIQSENSGKHVIDQGIFTGEGTEVITNIDFSNGASEVVYDVGVLSVDSSFINLRNPNYTLKKNYNFYFRSSYGSGNCDAGAIYSFWDKPLSFSASFYLQGSSVANVTEPNTYFNGVALLDVQEDVTFSGLPSFAGTNVFSNDDIQLVSLSTTSSGYYVNIVLTSPLSSSLLDDLKNKLMCNIESGTEYYIMAYRGTVNDNGQFTAANIVDCEYENRQCTVYYTDSYSLENSGLTTHISTDEIDEWCIGKPVLQIFCNIVNSTAPTTNYPALAVHIGHIES